MNLPSVSTSLNYSALHLKIISSLVLRLTPMNRYLVSLSERYENVNTYVPS